MITYADFQPGMDFGESRFAFDEDALAQWLALFPGDRASLSLMPPAMTVMVIMRTFTDLLRDRPPGNIHAGQKFCISRLPKLTETLTTRLGCLSKEIRKDRFWVRFGFDTADAAKAPLFRAEMTTIWSQ
jgi:hypothetical protein